MEQAGYHNAHAAFARQVNLHGRQTHGLTLRYDAASVYWWLRGRRPDSPAPQLIAEVLARRLGRQLIAVDLGFQHAEDLSGLGLTFDSDLDDARSTVTELWRRQRLRHEFLATAPFVAAATTQAGWRWHFDPRDANVSHRGTRQVTEADVETLRAYEQQFLELDRRHGGGHSRDLLIGWLVRDVQPLLNGAYSDRIGRQLFAAVAELTGQVAYMSYDVGEHGLAQRHFIQALRLAKAGDHSGFGAHILANLSTQAVYLQQPAEAVRLSRAAVDGGRGKAGSGIMARLYAAEACAHAIAADPRSCTAALRNAERAASRASDGDHPAWAGYFTPAHLAGAAVRCFRDLGRTNEALSFADQALDLGRSSIRTRALHTALIASVHASGSAADPEQACHLGRQALDLAGGVTSRRVADRIADLAQRMKRFGGNPAIDSFLHRAATAVSPA
ncbi:MFS transporter [Rhizocola hellebori]|uniref:MFS transporter n=1 Tax=Rhizocola hellebori TaxID=1392758 RepID=A0A8J3QAY5_9ACTN|nr:MFS transporter [Rhizocola hellebori]